MKTDWRKDYSRFLAIADGVVVLWAVSGALILRFGSLEGREIISDSGEPYILVTALLACAWWIVLGTFGARDITIVGYGTDEFKRILSASCWVFGIVAIFSYAFQLEIARGYVALALPAGVLSLFLTRFILRSYLRSQRRVGKNCSTVLVVGGSRGAAHLIRALRREPAAGYLPIATYLPGSAVGTTVDPSLGLPNLGHSVEAKDIEIAVHTARPDAVALSSGVPLSPWVIRELGWALSDMGVKMIMAPALTDVAGPRIHTQPVAGLPLIHVSTPKLSGNKWAVKRVFDVIGAAVLLILLSPIFAVTAMALKLTSPGPIFYRQERIGIRGRTFSMIKFRSMAVNADTRLQELLVSQGSASTPLFKVQNDPRITPVGAILRRYSIDELPQLLNVLSGSMSLVGPRPQRAQEVALYDRGAHRRLYVSPGMSGLWQVSGRSNLSWEEAIQLDLYYVENWSLSQDVTILLKTFRAVLSRDGAI